jgi:cell division protein FtsL
VWDQNSPTPPKTKRKIMTYSSSIALGRRSAFARNQNAVSFKEQVRTIGPISNTIILIVLTCLLGLLYLTQVTKTNTFGYKIHDLESQQTKLSTEHEDLQVSAARLQALERVKQSEVAKSLVSVAPTATIQN